MNAFKKISQVPDLDSPENISRIRTISPYLKQIIWVEFSLILTKLYPLIEQASASRISNDHLRAISILSFIALIPSLIGQSFGLPLLVIISRKGDEKIKSEILGTIITFS
jgi:Na+-driven multidrug efflux pump